MLVPQRPTTINLPLHDFVALHSKCVHHRLSILISFLSQIAKFISFLNVDCLIADFSLRLGFPPDVTQCLHLIHGAKQCAKNSQKCNTESHLFPHFSSLLCLRAQIFFVDLMRNVRQCEKNSQTHNFICHLLSHASFVFGHKILQNHFFLHFQAKLMVQCHAGFGRSCFWSC